MVGLETPGNNVKRLQPTPRQLYLRQHLEIAHKHTRLTGSAVGKPKFRLRGWRDLSVPMCCLWVQYLTVRRLQWLLCATAMFREFVVLGNLLAGIAIHWFFPEVVRHGQRWEVAVRSFPYSRYLLGPRLNGLIRALWA